jgi:hypothetical protein
MAPEGAIREIWSKKRQQLTPPDWFATDDAAQLILLVAFLPNAWMAERQTTTMSAINIAYSTRLAPVSPLSR